MPWHIQFKINIKHPPWQPFFLKHRYLRETKRQTSFSCLYFNLDVLAKNSPSSDVTGDFCSSSLRRKSLALDEYIFGLRLEMSIQAVEEGNLIGCLRNPSQNVTRFLNTSPRGNEGKTHKRTHKRSFNHLSKSHTDTAVNQSGELFSMDFFFPSLIMKACRGAGELLARGFHI